MGIPKPISREEAPAELQKSFEALESEIGKVPNLFGTVARFPEAMKAFLQFYDAVMNKGNIDTRYKELAYLKTSAINDCRY
jgi:alkylhydroperoxidase family enzyme